MNYFDKWERVESESKMYLQIETGLMVEDRGKEIEVIFLPIHRENEELLVTTLMELNWNDEFKLVLSEHQSDRLLSLLR